MCGYSRKLSIFEDRGMALNIAKYSMKRESAILEEFQEQPELKFIAHVTQREILT